MEFLKVWAKHNFCYIWYISVYIQPRYLYLIFRSVNGNNINQVILHSVRPSFWKKRVFSHASRRGSTESSCEISDPWWWLLADLGMITGVWETLVTRVKSVGWIAILRLHHTHKNWNVTLLFWYFGVNINMSSKLYLTLLNRKMKILCPSDNAWLYSRSNQPGSHDFRRFLRQFWTDFLKILQRPFSIQILTALKISKNYIAYFKS